MDAIAESDFFTSTSTMAACTLAATSAFCATSSACASCGVAGPSGRAWASRFTWVSTAVFRPANEKSRSPLCSKGRGNL
ncbi:hypothetical protein D3C72_2111380 [compost metagenome]